MSSVQTVQVPVNIVQKLERVLGELEKAISPYKADFLARMYRARASDLEGKGKSLEEIKHHFQED